MRQKKRAQIWSLDLMAGVALFLVGIMMLSIYLLNQPGEAKSNLELLFYDGKIIANNLMSPGYPIGWDSTDIVTPGITTNNKINETKLEALYDIINTDNNYNLTKNLFNTKYEYYFFLDENMVIDSNEVEGVGKPGTTKENINPKNLIKITRFTIYKNKTTPFYLYIWEE